MTLETVVKSLTYITGYDMDIKHICVFRHQPEEAYGFVRCHFAILNHIVSYLLCGSSTIEFTIRSIGTPPVFTKKIISMFIGVNEEPRTQRPIEDF